jgi:hypothetical protein
MVDSLETQQLDYYAELFNDKAPTSRQETSSKFHKTRQRARAVKAVSERLSAWNLPDAYNSNSAQLVLSGVRLIPIESNFSAMQDCQSANIVQKRSVQASSPGAVSARRTDYLACT